VIVTILLAVLLLLLACIGLAIGRLITGKEKLRCGRCGTPEKKDCTLCKKNSESKS
jgi:hypothetical protein